MKRPRSKKPVNNNSIENCDDIRDEPPPELTTILKETQGLSKEDKARIIRSATFSGPLPPPSAFAEYNNVLPGSAERILAMAEKEQAIRGKDNQKCLHNDRLLICFSTLVSLCLIGGGVFVIYIGQPLSGSIISLAGLIIGFFKEVMRRTNHMNR